MGTVGASGHIQHLTLLGGGGGGYAGCGSRCLSGSAPSASMAGAGSIPVVAARWTRPPLDPFEYRWRHALLQVCGAATWFAFFWGGGYQKNRRDLHLIHRLWRVLMSRRVVTTMPAGKLYVQGNQDSNPRS